MNHKIINCYLAIFLIIFFTSGQVFGNTSQDSEVSQERLTEFAKCMTEKGWTMYSSFTCPACRAQQNLFGQATVHLKIIECNPHAPDTQVEQCLKKNIRHTPTWLMKQNGTEIKRSTGYKKLSILSAMTGCNL
jgi:glutaredoxin